MENNKWYKNWKILTIIALTIIAILSISLGLFFGLKDNSKSNEITNPIPPGYEISEMDEVDGAFFKIHLEREVHLDIVNMFKYDAKEYQSEIKLDAYVGLDLVYGNTITVGVEKGVQPFHDVVLTLHNGTLDLNISDPISDLSFFSTLEANATFDSVYFEFFTEYMHWSDGSGDVWKKYWIINDLNINGNISKDEIDTSFAATTEQLIGMALYSSTRDLPISEISDFFWYKQSTFKNLTYDATFANNLGNIDDVPEDIHYVGDATTLSLVEGNYSDDMSVYGEYEHLNELLTNGVLAKEFTPQYIWTSERARLYNSTFELPTLEWLENNQV